MSECKYLQLKMKKHALKYQYRKLKLICQMKFFHGQYLLKMMLKKIQVAKDLFIIDIEQEGNETKIPAEIGEYKLPLSFRFYDPLVKMVQIRMTQDQREYYKLKNEMEIKILSEHNPKQRFLRKLGMTR